MYKKKGLEFFQFVVFIMSNENRSSDQWECTPPSRADIVTANKALLPEKSRAVYEKEDIDTVLVS